MTRTLADLSGVLAIRCTRCDLSYDVSVAALIRRYGADMRLPDLRREACRHCPRSQADLYTRCDVWFPELREG